HRTGPGAASRVQHGTRGRADCHRSGGDLRQEPAPGHRKDALASVVPAGTGVVGGSGVVHRVGDDRHLAGRDQSRADLTIGLVLYHDTILPKAFPAISFPRPIIEAYSVMEALKQEPPFPLLRTVHPDAAPRESRPIG